jgi:hypothetical protein
MTIDRRWDDVDGVMDFTLQYPIAVYILPVDYTLFTNSELTSTVFLSVYYNHTLDVLLEELKLVFNIDTNKHSDNRVYKTICFLAERLFNVFRTCLCNELEFMREYEMSKIITLEKCMGGVTIGFTIEW